MTINEEIEHPEPFGWRSTSKMSPHSRFDDDQRGIRGADSIEQEQEEYKTTSRRKPDLQPFDF
jgi:hypothetical protein